MNKQTIFRFVGLATVFLLVLIMGATILDWIVRLHFWLVLFIGGILLLVMGVVRDKWFQSFIGVAIFVATGYLAYQLGVFGVPADMNPSVQGVAYRLDEQGNPVRTSPGQIYVYYGRGSVNLGSPVGAVEIRVIGSDLGLSNLLIVRQDNPDTADVDEYSEVRCAQTAGIAEWTEETFRLITRGQVGFATAEEDYYCTTLNAGESSRTEYSLFVRHLDGGSDYVGQYIVLAPAGQTAEPVDPENVGGAQRLVPPTITQTITVTATDVVTNP